LAIRIRRFLVAALYDKTIKLSVKSMTETNSGKLISLINGDLTQVEQHLHIASFAIAAPFITCIAFYYISMRLENVYLAIIFGF